MNGSHQGRIFQINRSDGGVPKTGMYEAEVRTLGLVGDRHNNTKVHGGPERALCLYSLERILTLQAEGHLAFPGSLGENLTLVGLDWDLVVPNSRLHVGREVVLEVTRYTTPCGNIALSFSDGDSQRISPDRHPGWARVYVRVIHEGKIKVGDVVLLQPEAS